MAKAIGSAIRAAREARGLTQRELAKAIGMTVPQLSNLEAGTPENPGWKTVVKLAKALGLSLDEAAGLKAAKPLMAQIPSAVTIAVEKARGQVSQTLETLDKLSDRLRTR